LGVQVYPCGTSQLPTEASAGSIRSKLIDCPAALPPPLGAPKVPVVFAPASSVPGVHAATSTDIAPAVPVPSRARRVMAAAATSRKYSLLLVLQTWRAQALSHLSQQVTGLRLPRVSPAIGRSRREVTACTPFRWRILTLRDCAAGVSRTCAGLERHTNIMCPLPSRSTGQRIGCTRESNDRSAVRDPPRQRMGRGHRSRRTPAALPGPGARRHCPVRSGPAPTRLARGGPGTLAEPHP